MSARKNESESAKAIAIDQSSYGLFKDLINDALNRCGVSTRALANTRSGHCTGQMESFMEETKSFLFFFPNKLADPLGLELLEL